MHIGHVTLDGPLPRERAHPFLERRGSRVGHDLAVGLELVLGARVDDAVEAVGSERVADRVEQLDRELAVAIREQAPGFGREHPFDRRPAPPRPRPRQLPSFDEAPLDRATSMCWRTAASVIPSSAATSDAVAPSARFRCSSTRCFAVLSGLAMSGSLRLPQALT